MSIDPRKRRQSKLERSLLVDKLCESGRCVCARGNKSDGRMRNVCMILPSGSMVSHVMKHADVQFGKTAWPRTDPMTKRCNDFSRRAIRRPCLAYWTNGPDGW